MSSWLPNLYEMKDTDADLNSVIEMLQGMICLGGYFRIKPKAIARTAASYLGFPSPAPSRSSADCTITQDLASLFARPSFFDFANQSKDTANESKAVSFVQPQLSFTYLSSVDATEQSDAPAVISPVESATETTLEEENRSLRVRLAAREQELEERTLCSICEDAEANTVLNNCRHLCLLHMRKPN